VEERLEGGQEWLTLALCAMLHSVSPRATLMDMAGSVTRDMPGFDPCACGHRDKTLPIQL